MNPIDGKAVMPRVWTVAGLVHAIADSLQVRFASVSVRGEISGYTRAASGHAYFTLKDDRGAAALRCAMFRRAVMSSSQSGFTPRDGQLVEAVGQVAVYEARGELQLVVERLQPAGEGAWYEQFLRLKARLETEGLFDPARKQVLPQHPRRIAVVTSKAAAAWRDVMQVLSRRAPHVEVILVPCLVQGTEAPPQIVEALRAVQSWSQAGHGIDAVLLCRGGGSIEDLWAFNDERVVRAISACTLPIVCGVGHETDVTLADFAADVRAPTPSAAAELICGDRQEAMRALQALQSHLVLRSHRMLDVQAQRIDRLASRLARPAALVAKDQAHLDRQGLALRQAWAQHRRQASDLLTQHQHRLGRAAPMLCEQQHVRLLGLASALNALSPQRVLERGYAWLSHPGGGVVSGVSVVRPGDRVQAALRDGVLHLHVDGVAPDESGP